MAEAKKVKTIPFPVTYHEQHKEKPQILVMEWDSTEEVWLYDIWSAENPFKKLSLCGSKEEGGIPKKINEALGEDIKVTSEKGLVFINNRNVLLGFSPTQRSTKILPPLPFNMEDVSGCFLGFIGKGTEVSINLLLVTTTEYHLVRLEEDAAGCTQLIYQPVEPHIPDNRNKGVCIDGVLYYEGYTGDCLPTLMKFDIKSKVFTLIPLPDIDWEFGSFTWSAVVLFGFHGKPAIARISMDHSQPRLWILEEDFSWKETIIIPTTPIIQGIDEDNYIIEFVGSDASQKKLIFYLFSFEDTKNFVVYYDPVSHKSERLPIRGQNFEKSTCIWNHISGVWL